MDEEDLPEPWRMAAERAGIRQSLRGIAEAAGVGHPTVGRLIEGGSTSPSISLVASVLRVTEEQVREWAGAKTPAGEPWEPPEASRLEATGGAARLEPRLGTPAARTPGLLPLAYQNADDRAGTSPGRAAIRPCS